MAHHVREADEQAPNSNLGSVRKTYTGFWRGWKMIRVRESRDRHFQGEETAFAKAWWSEEALEWLARGLVVREVTPARQAVAGK